ncbi:hypothetical protein L917_15878 [Phytophthora nicotianae]|uniref:Uncharacterized protein n=1 Tax=Phytophthora nicotianae TaxID=4792 RepID=W2KGI7_PHYNI|nr:hypothetical protein L917_15878 [Phytophthora nicotianae]
MERVCQDGTSTIVFVATRPCDAGQNGKSISTASSASKIDNKESYKRWKLKFEKLGDLPRALSSSHYMDPPMSSSSGGPTYEEMAKK